MTRISRVTRTVAFVAVMSPTQLKTLYKDKQGYMAKVRQRVDELTRQGWSLPVYRQQILADAAKITF